MEWLDQLPRRPAAVIRAFVCQFERNGIDKLKNRRIFEVQSVRKAGGPEALREAGDAPGELARVTKERIFTAWFPVCDRGVSPGLVSQASPGLALDLLPTQGKSANFLYPLVFTDDFSAKNCKILLDMTAAGFYNRSRE